MDITMSSKKRYTNSFMNGMELEIVIFRVNQKTKFYQIM